MSAHLHQIRIHLVLAELAWARGEPESTFAEIEQVFAFAVLVGSKQEIRSARALHATYWLYQNHSNFDRGWASESELTPD
jgi:hypothetical protein